MQLSHACCLSCDKDEPNRTGSSMFRSGWPSGTSTHAGRRSETTAIAFPSPRLHRMLFGNHRSVLTALECNIVVDRSFFVIAVQSAVLPTIPAPASSGPGQMIVDAGGMRLTVFTYRPGGCRARAR